MMEINEDLAPNQEKVAPASGLFVGKGINLPTPTPTSGAGFLREMEQMPNFDIPSEESFTKNFLNGRKGLLYIEP